MAFPSSQKPETVAEPSRRPPSGNVSIVSSDEVLRGRQELHINHGDAIYTLRVTRQGKLILTK